MTVNLTCGETQWIQPERRDLMGDKKGKKDKAKGQRQKDAKQVKTNKQKQERKQTLSK